MERKTTDIKSTPCEITEEFGRLTKHPHGTLKELFAISFPLMLSILSGNLMLFFDRLLLARYSLDAMNAAASAGMTVMVIQLGAIGIASISEVFVGQHNGAKKYALAASPAWQMVWFSLATSVLFFGMARFGGPWVLADFYYQQHGLPYFQWLLYFGPIFSMVAAFSGFFIGIGSVRLVTWATISANILNVILDLAFIFGLPPYIPSMGTMGAALATGLAQTFQMTFVLCFFFRPKFLKKYHTYDWRFKPKLFLKCLRVGSPSSIGHMIEIAAWAILVRMMLALSPDHATVVTIGQSLFALVAFAMEGLQKAVTTIAANFIGAHQWSFVKKTWRSAIKLLAIMALLFGFFLLVYPDPLIKEFLYKSTSSAHADHLFTLIRLVCVGIWVYFIFDGITWISAGAFNSIY